jgi:hypothetical protein
MKPILFALLAVSSPAALAVNTFDLTLNYTGDPLYLSVFQSAEVIWESVIPAYLDGNQGTAQFTGISINASIDLIDGPGAVLGSAGPTFGGYDDSGYLLVTGGDMQFDSADFASLSPTLQLTVILHEMGHVIGLGTVWDLNGLYTVGTGQYTGAHGLAAYQQEYNQPLATFVPVELGGGAGTADGHWDETDGGAGLTGRTSQYHGISPGDDMQYELMTGWLNVDQPYYISEVTRGSLRDLGYDVTYQGLVLVPEPSVALLGLAALAFRCGTRRRR